MKIFQSFLLATLFVFSACEKTEPLPETDMVMVKFVNKTGADLTELYVSRAEISELKKGKTTGEYFGYQQLGQQYGYALVEAVGTINGRKFFTGSACQGTCGTPSAPQGTWLEAGYYKIGIYLAKNEANALEFKLLD